MSETTTTPRRVYRTAQIKPRTRDALMDVLAQAADEIIRLRTVADSATFAVWEWSVNTPSARKPQPWWRRLAQQLVRCWPP